MAKIDGQNRIRQAIRQLEVPNLKSQKSKAVAPKEEDKPKTRANNSNTLRAENQNFANQQRLKLNRLLKKEENRDNSAIIGGTAGSTAGQFAQNEAKVRNSGKITIKNTEYGYNAQHGYFKNQNANTNDFVNKVRRDLQQLAPGTKVQPRPSDPINGLYWDMIHGNDTAAIVKPAPVKERVRGHDSGYRLIDQLNNNRNEIAIHKDPAQFPFSNPREWNNSSGTVDRPGKGSAVDVTYDPNLVMSLPGKNKQGQYVNANTSSVIILGHELGHASHMQRGTFDSRIGDGGKTNTFKVDGRNFRETYNQQTTGALYLREEFRNVGTRGYGYGKEPTENRLRAELKDPNQRVSYQSPPNPYQEITNTQALAIRAKNRLDSTGEVARDGLKGSRNSALIGGGFSAITALAQGKDAKGVLQDTALGAGTGVAQELIERAVNGPRTATSGMTASPRQAARATVKGAAVAGGLINTGFAIHDQWNNLKNKETRSEAIGTIAGEAAVGATAGAAGAYAGAMAGAAIGSIVPGVGTVIGGIVGFAVGAGVGFLADKGLRALGVDKVVAKGVTAVVDTGKAVVDGAKEVVGEVVEVAKDAGRRIRRFFGF